MAKGKILVVDDDPDVREVILLALEPVLGVPVRLAVADDINLQFRRPVVDGAPPDQLSLQADAKIQKEKGVLHTFRRTDMVWTTPERRRRGMVRALAGQVPLSP